MNLLEEKEKTYEGNIENGNPEENSEENLYPWEKSGKKMGFVRKKLVDYAHKDEDRFKEGRKAAKEMARHDIAEYDENGHLKRSGYKPWNNTVNFGEDFEKETFDEVYKRAVPILIGILILMVLAMAATVWLLVIKG